MLLNVQDKKFFVALRVKKRQSYISPYDSQLKKFVVVVWCIIIVLMTSKGEEKRFLGRNRNQRRSRWSYLEWYLYMVRIVMYGTLFDADAT